MENLPYILQDNGITVFINKRPEHVSSTNVKYDNIKQALKDKDWERVVSLVSYGTAIKTYSHGKMKLHKGVVTYDNKALPGALSQRIINMVDEEMDLDPLINFVDLLKTNTSFNSVQQTYAFLEKNMLPITDDGFILAYKIVSFARTKSKKHNIKRGDLVDQYTGTLRNNMGDVVSMDRNEVDDNPNNLCSFGLHGGAESYYQQLRHGTNRVMIVIKVNPADIVAVPKYTSGSKFRCCKYEVISYYGDDHKKKLEDEVVVYKEKGSKSFDSAVDTRAQVLKAIDIAKTMITSYSRQRLTNKSGHWASVAGYVGYLQDVKFEKHDVHSIAQEIEAKTGFMSAKVKNGNLYITRA
jgi:hypothetical protein